jgi:hypothetical protein
MRILSTSFGILTRGQFPSRPLEDLYLPVLLVVRWMVLCKRSRVRHRVAFAEDRLRERRISCSWHKSPCPCVPYRVSISGHSSSLIH